RRAGPPCPSTTSPARSTRSKVAGSWGAAEGSAQPSARTSRRSAMAVRLPAAVCAPRPAGARKTRFPSVGGGGPRQSPPFLPMHPPSSVLAERGSTGPHDLVLVQQALRGDVASADALLQRLSCIVRFVYRLTRLLGCGLPADALEDVVQQVYAAVWPRLPDFAGSAAIE